MSNTDVVSKVVVGQEIKEPPMFKVIYLNDNKTTIEFVIETLMTFFDYTPETAHKICVDIHESGAATVAVLPFEIAEQKGIEVTMCARAAQFPLQIKIEPETIQ